MAQGIIDKTRTEPVFLGGICDDAGLLVIIAPILDDCPFWTPPS
jgi:hypothetical protein